MFCLQIIRLSSVSGTSEAVVFGIIVRHVREMGMQFYDSFFQRNRPYSVRHSVATELDPSYLINILPIRENQYFIKT